MTAPAPHDVLPYQIAEDTFLITWGLDAPPVGHFPMHSMLIRGREPVLVDTGAPACRQQWMATVANLVDLADIRWIFLSHDDRDHAGNLLPVLDACPNATLLTTWFTIGRMAEEWDTPLPRCRFVNDGDQIDAGDRILVAARPPVFDNPTTRGLLDSSTGIFWSVDTFATNTPDRMLEADELADDEFRDGQFLGARLVAPWHRYLDQNKWVSCVDAVHRLGATTIAGCHAPVLRGQRVEQAFDLLRQLPSLDPWREFDQSDLDGWLAHTGAFSEPLTPVPAP
jgi:flavorubredoxin